MHASAKWYGPVGPRPGIVKAQPSASWRYNCFYWFYPHNRTHSLHLYIPPSRGIDIFSMLRTTMAPPTHSGRRCSWTPRVKRLGKRWGNNDICLSLVITMPDWIHHKRRKRDIPKPLVARSAVGGAVLNFWCLLIPVTWLQEGREGCGGVMAHVM
jgi:hypothetical protein